MPHPPTPSQTTASGWWRRFGAGEWLGLACLLILGGFFVLALALDSSGDFLYQVNEYVVWLFVLVILGGAAEGGYWLGRRAKMQAGETVEATLDHTQEVQTAVLAVLGLLLAFTYSMAISRFDDRKQALTAGGRVHPNGLPAHTGAASRLAVHRGEPAAPVCGCPPGLRAP